MKVKEKMKVKVEYTGKLENGDVFDSSKKHGQPIEFEVGASQVIPGFEKAILGMEKGEKKEVTLPPSEAYGDRKEELVHKFPKSQFPQGQDYKEGGVVGVTVPTGQQVPATIVKVEDDSITLDMNPPLAGKTLIFELEVVGIEK